MARSRTRPSKNHEAPTGLPCRVGLDVAVVALDPGGGVEKALVPEDCRSDNEFINHVLSVETEVR